MGSKVGLTVPRKYGKTHPIAVPNGVVRAEIVD
jgi:hypothetical protein